VRDAGHADTIAAPGQEDTLPARGHVPTTLPATERQPADGEADPIIGAMVADRYQVEDFLGAGGMGLVYRAQQVAVDRTVVLKFLRSREHREGELARRFTREAKVISQLTSPNTIVLHDFGQTDDGQLFMAMEYLEGITLGSEIRRSGGLPPLRAMAIGLQILASLEEAHRQGTVHRDLKPENIMLVERSGTPDFVKVLDFGIAKVMGVGERNLMEQDEPEEEPTPDGQEGGDKLTHFGAVFGSPGYMSPEQVMGKDVDHRSDIYSFGVILYEMLSGEMPVSGTSRMEVFQSTLEGDVEPLTIRRPEVTLPRGLDELILRCLKRDPEDRPESVQWLAARLRAQSAVLAQRRQDEERALMDLAGLTSRWSKLRRWLSPALITFLLGALVWQAASRQAPVIDGVALEPGVRVFVSASGPRVPAWLERAEPGGVRVALRALPGREAAVNLSRAAVLARLADIPNRFDPGTERERFLDDLEKVDFQSKRLGADLQQQLGIKTFWTRFARGGTAGKSTMEYDATSYSPALPAEWAAELRRRFGEMRYDRYNFLLDGAVGARRCQQADRLAARIKEAIGHFADKPAKRSRLEFLLQRKVSRCRAASIGVSP